jgi:hypothetical protein
MPESDYNRDFYGWTSEQAALLRAGKFSMADIEHIAEEIECLGGSERRELVNCLGVLLLSLIKWRFQPKKRGSGREGSIHVQQSNLGRHLKANPSLKSRLPEAIDTAYRWAVNEVAPQIGLAASDLPAHCPWSFDEMMKKDFRPE